MCIIAKYKTLQALSKSYEQQEMQKFACVKGLLHTSSVKSHVKTIANLILTI